MKQIFKPFFSRYGKTKGFIKKARVRALPQATKSLGWM